jgi:uncharacterized membrane protein
MSGFAPVLLFVAALLAGCVFGFFYSWSFTVIRGLSATDGASAIAVMQSVNANIMTGWFALIFFGTPVATGLAALAAWAADGRGAAAWLAAATVIYLVGCFAVTVVYNVPMNDALAGLDARGIPDAAAAWTDYAGPWNAWNHVRTAACGAGFLCTLLALWRWPG